MALGIHGMVTLPDISTVTVRVNGNLPHDGEVTWKSSPHCRLLRWIRKSKGLQLPGEIKLIYKKIVVIVMCIRRIHEMNKFYLILSCDGVCLKRHTLDPRFAEWRTKRLCLKYECELISVTRRKPWNSINALAMTHGYKYRWFKINGHIQR